MKRECGILAAILLAKCIYDWLAWRAMMDTRRMESETAAIKDMIAKKRFSDLREHIAGVERRLKRDYVVSEQVADAETVDHVLQGLSSRVTDLEARCVGHE